MSVGEYEVLRDGLLAGKDRHRGEVLEAETAAKIAPPVLSALISEGWIKPIYSTDEERVLHLQARVDAMAEDRLELREGIAALRSEFATLAEAVNALVKASVTPVEAEVEVAEVKAEAVQTEEAPKPRRRGRPRKTAAKKES